MKRLNEPVPIEGVWGSGVQLNLRLVSMIELNFTGDATCCPPDVVSRAKLSLRCNQLVYSLRCVRAASIMRQCVFSLV